MIDDPNEDAAKPEDIAKKDIGYKISLFMPLIIIGGIAAVAIAYLLSMNALGWKSGPGNLMGAATAQSGELPVYLYESETTRHYLSSVGANYEVLLKPWQNYFSESKTSVEEVTSPSQIDKLSEGVLILPSSIALSETERQAIAGFHDRGGNILASWALGSRDEHGEWKGYDFYKNLLNVSVTGDIPANSEERYLNVYGETPVSYLLPAGKRIWMGKVSEAPLLIKGGRTAALFSNWQRSVNNDKNTTGVVYDEAGTDKKSARWVVYSFPESSWEYQRSDIYQLVHASLNWLQHTPSAFKGNWPSPYSAAQLVEMDTEQDFTNANELVTMADAANVPTTFYCLTSVAIKFPDVVKNLARNHEIGYHGDVHDGFKDQPDNVQQSRMDNMKSQMQSILGDISNNVGFRAPLESYDKTTEATLLKEGLRHHVADPNRSNARLPLFSDVSNNPPETALVVLPRTQRDDINLIKDGVLGGMNTEKLSQSLIDEFNQSADMGGLGILSIHTQNFAPGSALNLAMPGYLNYISKKRASVWLAPANQIANWWRERERVEFSVSGPGSKLDMNVTINGREPLQAVRIIITNPIQNAVVKVQAAKANLPLPTVESIDDLRTALIFKDFMPGDYSYTIAF